MCNADDKFVMPIAVFNKEVHFGWIKNGRPQTQVQFSTVQTQYRNLKGGSNFICIFLHEGLMHFNEKKYFY